MAAHELSEADLRNWKLLDDFQNIVEEVFGRAELHPSLEDPRRKINYRPYLSLFLFGLFNPIVESMRGLCAISELKRVQEEVSRGKVSLGSFSEIQAVLDPDLLHKVFQRLVEKTKARETVDPRLAHMELIAQDGSLWRALPRMSWAHYGVGPKGEAKGVRLHLRFNVIEGKPVDAEITPGIGCERKALRQMCRPGQVNVGDRYYGGDYRLFKEIDQAKAFFVFRLRDHAIIHQQEEIPLSEADKAAGVVRHAWVCLGAHQPQHSIRLRLVEIHAAGEQFLLVTNLPLEDNPAHLIGAIYRRRWDIELYFRWIKCIFKCRHFFAESRQGAAIQIYLALIASLLLQDLTGRRPSKRLMELFHFFMAGWATAEEVARLAQKYLAPKKSKQA